MYAEVVAKGVSRPTESKGKGLKRGLLSFVHNALFLINRKGKETSERILYMDECGYVCIQYRIVDTYGICTVLMYPAQNRQMTQTPQSCDDSFSKILSHNYWKIRTAAVQHLVIFTQLVRRMLRTSGIFFCEGTFAVCHPSIQYSSSH